MTGQLDARPPLFARIFARAEYLLSSAHTLLPVIFSSSWLASSSRRHRRRGCNSQLVRLFRGLVRACRAEHDRRSRAPALARLAQMTSVSRCPHLQSASSPRTWTAHQSQQLRVNLAARYLRQRKTCASSSPTATTPTGRLPSDRNSTFCLQTQVLVSGHSQADIVVVGV